MNQKNSFHDNLCLYILFNFNAFHHKHYIEIIFIILYPHSSEVTDAVPAKPNVPEALKAAIGMIFFPSVSSSNCNGFVYHLVMALIHLLLPVLRDFQSFFWIFSCLWLLESGFLIGVAWNVGFPIHHSAFSGLCDPLLSDDYAHPGLFNVDLFMGCRVT